MKKLVLLSAVFCACAAFAVRQPLSRYQTIVDRQMFGQPPPGFDPTKPASEVSSSRAEQRELTQEQAKLQSSVQFSVINITPEGDIAVGFSDNSDPKQPRHYYLKVGEERDGWLVKEADPAEASMTIAKGDIEVELKIGENSAKGGTTRAASGPPDGSPPRSPMMGSLRGRRKWKLAEQQRQNAALDEKRAQEKAERDAREAEEKAQRLQEREEQRQQLLAIQEELKRAREARAKDKSEGAPENADN